MTFHYRDIDASNTVILENIDISNSMPRLCTVVKYTKMDDMYNMYICLLFVSAWPQTCVYLFSQTN